QNAGDANTACHHQAENGVEEKIPPAHAQTFLVSPITIERDEQERAAENEMEDADDDKKREAFPNFMRRYEQNIANQHVLDFLVAFRRAAEQQDRSSSSHDIRNSDDRFLRDLARTFSGYRKNGPSDQSESERDAESGPTLKVEMKQNCETNSQRRHLRHGDVNENDAALHNMQAEINEQPRQKHASHDWPKHYLPHDYFIAAAIRETSASIRAT